MSHQLRTKLLAEAIRIGDEILLRAQTEREGVFWETFSGSLKNDTEHWGKSETIYSGVSGIVLFLLELYQITQKEQYLHTAVSGMKWVKGLCKKSASSKFAFLTGRLGAAYAMLKLAEKTRDEQYLQNALDISVDCSRFLEQENTRQEYINGVSGALLGLLHLHQATGEEHILADINRFIERLLERAHLGPQGLYWDRSPQQVAGLCGFSHGAAGVGFVFLELAAYFQNEAFHWMAEQAFAYESFYFSANIKNWPDLRKTVFTTDELKEHDRQYLGGNFEFFFSGKDMNAWCHGAAGIGLARLRAFELTKNEIYKKDITRAVRKTMATLVSEQNVSRSYTLCHGYGGDCELFLECYRILKERKYLGLAMKTAFKAIIWQEEKGFYLSGNVCRNISREDLSLFLGAAGIGYFYLRCLEPLKIPSILLPKLYSNSIIQMQDSKYSFITITSSDIKKMLLKKSFRRTIAVCKDVMADKLWDGLDSTNGRQFLEIFKKHIKGLILSSLNQLREPLSEIFSVEDEQLTLSTLRTSNAFLRTKARLKEIRASKLLAMDKTLLTSVMLFLDPDICIKLNRWDWKNAKEDLQENFSRAPGTFGHLFYPTPSGINEEQISEFSYIVLSAFKNGKRTQSAILHINSSLSVTTKQFATLSSLVVEQVREAIKAGFLVEKRFNIRSYKPRSS